MACLECGSPKGTIAQPCPDCVSQRKNRRAASKPTSLIQESSSARGDDLINEASQSLVFKILFALVPIPIGLVAFSFIGPVKSMGALPIILYSIAFAAIVVGLWTYFMLWVKIFVNEPTMGFAALLLPGVIVWRWAVFNFDITKTLLITHSIAFFVAIVSSSSLAFATHRPFSEVQSMLLHFAKDASPHENISFGANARAFQVGSTEYKSPYFE